MRAAALLAVARPARGDRARGLRRHAARRIAGPHRLRLRQGPVPGRSRDAAPSRRLTRDGGRGQPYRRPVAVPQRPAARLRPRHRPLPRPRRRHGRAPVEDSLPVEPRALAVGAPARVPEHDLGARRLPAAAAAGLVRLASTSRSCSASAARRPAPSRAAAPSPSASPARTCWRRSTPDPDAGIPASASAASRRTRTCTEVRAADALRDLYSPEGSPDGRFVVAVASPLARRRAQAAFTGHIALFRAAGGAFVRDLSFGPDAEPDVVARTAAASPSSAPARSTWSTSRPASRGGWSGHPPGLGAAVRRAALARRARRCSRSAPAAAQAEDPIRVFGASGDGEGQFQRPRGIAVDANGYVYVADSEAAPADEVRARRQGRARHRQPGGGRRLRGAARRRARPRPWASPSRRTARIVVAEATGHTRISAGPPTAATAARSPTFGVDPGQLASPQGIAVAPDGTVYVADTGNDRVSAFAADGTFLRLIGDGRVRRRPAGPAPARAASPSTPTARSGSPTAPGTSSSTTPPTARSSARCRSTATPASRTAPTGVAIGPGHVFHVAHPPSDLVRRWSDAGVAAGAPVGNGEGEAAGETSRPEYVAFDCRGRLYVSDGGNDRVQVFGDAAAPAVRHAGRRASRDRSAARRPQRFRQRFAVVVRPECPGRTCTVDPERHGWRSRGASPSRCAALGAPGPARPRADGRGRRAGRPASSPRCRPAPGHRHDRRARRRHGRQRRDRQDRGPTALNERFRGSECRYRRSHRSAAGRPASAADAEDDGRSVDSGGARPLRRGLPAPDGMDGPPVRPAPVPPVRTARSAPPASTAPRNRSSRVASCTRWRRSCGATRRSTSRATRSSRRSPTPSRSSSTPPARC